MRVGIVALLHESNTFAGSTTPLARFEEDLLVEGESVRDRLAGTHHEVAGFFEQLAEDGVEAVPVFAARAMPSGTIEAVKQVNYVFKPATKEQWLTMFGAA